MNKLWIHQHLLIVFAKRMLRPTHHPLVRHAARLLNAPTWINILGHGMAGLTSTIVLFVFEQGGDLPRFPHSLPECRCRSGLWRRVYRVVRCQVLPFDRALRSLPWRVLDQPVGLPGTFWVRSLPTSCWVVLSCWSTWLCLSVSLVLCSISNLEDSMRISFCTLHSYGKLIILNLFKDTKIFPVIS